VPPQDADRTPGGDVVELDHPGHEVAVDIGRQGPGHGIGKTGKVASMQEHPRRALCPAPQRQVFEEGLQGGDPLMGALDGYRLASAPSTSGRPSPVPGEELLEHRTVELFELFDLWVVLAQPHPERLQDVSAVLHRRRAQGGGARLEVAQDDTADLWLGNRRHLVGQGP